MPEVIRKITADPEVDAVYLDILEGEHHHTEVVENDDGMVVIDYDAEGNVLGIEFIGIKNLVETLRKEE